MLTQNALLLQFAFLAKQHLKLHQVEEFQVTMPKEAIPTKPKPLPASSAQPTATAPGQSTNANTSGAKSTERGDKGLKPEASSVSTKTQPLGNATNSNVSSSSVNSKEGSNSSSGSSSSSSSSRDKSVFGSNGISVGVKDATVSDSSDVSVRPSEKAVPSSTEGNAPAVTSSRVDVSPVRSGSSNAVDADRTDPTRQQALVDTAGKTDDAPAQVHQAEQQKTQAGVNQAADTDEEEEEQAVSGSVRKSGFRFAGTGLQLRVSQVC